MHTKKIFFIILSYFFFLFFSNQVKAVNTSYCDYNDDLSLILPVTIGVEVEGINIFYPFQELYNVYYQEQLLVYDENSCELYLDDSRLDSSEYIINANYYFQYNDTKKYVPFIGGGKFVNIDRTAPTISSSFPVFLADVGQLIDLERITSTILAQDDTEGKLIPEAIYDNYSENYNDIGEYNIIFQACDSSNNCANTTVKIIVRDRIPPSISGTNEYTSYISNPIDTNNIIYNLEAKDNHTVNFSEKIELLSSNYKKSIPGIYYLYYTVSDNSGNSLLSPFKVTITVIDDVAPTIEGPTSYISKLSNLISTDYIIGNLIVTDNVDSNAYKNIYIIEDSYTPNKNKIGMYYLIVSTYDIHTNDAQPYIITVEVIDDIIPMIDGTNEYTSYLSSPITISMIKNNLLALDNHDGNLIHEIEVQDDNYTNNKNSLGVYNITFIVTDYSNNSSTPFIVTIITIDDVKPTIDGVNSYHTLNNEKLDINYIKSELTAVDNVDGDISSNIVIDTDTYSDNYYIPGNYYLSLYVNDKSGNISNYYKVKITVNQQKDIIDTLSDSHVLINTETCLDHKQIIDLIGIDQTNYLSITPVSNSYTENFSSVGNYKVSYEVTYKDYSKKTLDINISTFENEKKDDILTVNNINTNQKKETIFTKIISFFKTIFYNIANFFKRLFR